MMFIRSIEDKNVISRLLEEDLFAVRILPDCKGFGVFPAIRKDCIDFYHFGSRLFQYKDCFKTHRKFISLKTSDSYVSEKDLKDPIQSMRFVHEYEEIKKASKVYANVESIGVSSLYSKYSYLNKKCPIVVLDIEISFESLNEEKDFDRIDLLLFNKSEQMLFFVEAKHYSNSHIWRKKGEKPRVIKQIGRYNSQIQTRKKEIIDNYKKYINNVNSIFNVNLPEPKDCISECGLYVFGYDSDQFSGRMDKLILKDGSVDGLRFYTKGDPDGTKIVTMWKKMQEKHKTGKRH